MRRRPLVLGILLFGTGCRADPSPAQLHALFEQHPDILYDVLRAHPAELGELMRVAASSADSIGRVAVARADSARVEEGLRHPKVPSIGQRAALGDPTAAITLVEYMDFECPYCRRARSTLVDLMEAHAGHIRLVIKHTPLDEHAEAMPAALMFEAIARQSPAAAFRFYDDVFEHQDQLRADGARFLRRAAARAGVNATRAEVDAASPHMRAIIDADMAEAKSFGLEGTPCFLVNGVPIIGAQPESTFEHLIVRTSHGS